MSVAREVMEEYETAEKPVVRERSEGIPLTDIEQEVCDRATD